MGKFTHTKKKKRYKQTGVLNSQTRNTRMPKYLRYSYKGQITIATSNDH